MAKVYTTPGVYIEEIGFTANSVVPVATSIPCFIGFTEFAQKDKISLTNKPFKVSSLVEYNRYFGGPPKITFDIAFSQDNSDIVTAKPLPQSQFFLYNSLRLFFNNGGRECYIFSVGNYSEEASSDSVSNSKKPLNITMVQEALKQLEKEPEPSLILIPDGHSMEKASDYYALWQLVLPHCRKMINRFAIIDIHGGGNLEKIKNQSSIDSLLEDFRNGIGNQDLSYGAIYWPWLQTSIIEENELDASNIHNLEDAKTHILEEALKNYPQLPADNSESEPKDHPNFTKIKAAVDLLGKAPADKTKDSSVIPNPHKTLLQISSAYKAIFSVIREVANILPPSGAMAGIYASVDANIGVHKAPANVSVASVVKPLVTIDHQAQEGLNAPLDGKSINAIRSFPGRGVLVWGARTMDGNSLDWRYISVRRTISMIELSVKYAARAYVFEPNTSSTWVTVKSMISNFLDSQWRSGALAGATPEDAYSVDVGLGITMTAVDILEGIMRISLKIAVTRPAEFIVITFEQQMQKS